MGLHRAIDADGADAKSTYFAVKSRIDVNEFTGARDFWLQRAFSAVDRPADQHKPASGLPDCSSFERDVARYSIFERMQGARVTHFNWSPGIGDPTIGGWLTVALYLLASLSCWTSARKIALQDACSLQERRAWRSISALFLALGVNKQLDLQTALTEAGRVLAHTQGWYAQREFVQLAFIALVATTCLGAMHEIG